MEENMPTTEGSQPGMPETAPEQSPMEMPEPKPEKAENKGKKKGGLFLKLIIAIVLIGGVAALVVFGAQGDWFQGLGFRSKVKAPAETMKIMETVKTIDAVDKLKEAETIKIDDAAMKTVKNAETIKIDESAIMTVKDAEAVKLEGAVEKVAVKQTIPETIKTVESPAFIEVMARGGQLVIDKNQTDVALGTFSFSSDKDVVIDSVEFTIFPGSSGNFGEVDDYFFSLNLFRDGIKIDGPKSLIGGKVTFDNLNMTVGTGGTQLEIHGDTSSVLLPGTSFIFGIESETDILTQGTFIPNFNLCGAGSCSSGADIVANDVAASVTVNNIVAGESIYGSGFVGRPDMIGFAFTTNEAFALLDFNFNGCASGGNFQLFNERVELPVATDSNSDGRISGSEITGGVLPAGNYFLKLDTSSCTANDTLTVGFDMAVTQDGDPATVQGDFDTMIQF